ncbi:MAG: 2-dehydropantoate 2-reductase [Subtercola sp.]|nr:2-dehydropantoate 2-reductase [Subtercola sp.]
MQIAIVGAGAIGGSIAAALDRAGHSVELAARGENLAVIRRQGIQLRGAWGEHVARVNANETITVRPELALVCTKAQDAQTAIEANAEALRGLPIVIVQNGLEALDTAEAALPDATWMGALALYATSYLAPGEITVTTSGPTYIGAGVGAPSPAIRAATGVLAGAIPAEAIGNFRGAQWSKLIVNQVNAMPAITGLSAQQTLTHPLLNPVITASMREAVRIGFARGIHYGSVQGLSNALLRLFGAAPLRVGGALPRLMARRMGETPNPGSTLQSIRRGQLTEIDYLNGAVVAQARLAGRSAPINQVLVDLVHGVERTGDFVTPEAVVAAVATAHETAAE